MAVGSLGGESFSQEIYGVEDGENVDSAGAFSYLRGNKKLQSLVGILLQFPKRLVIKCSKCKDFVLVLWGVAKGRCRGQSK